ncbi:DoxX family membrane protein [Nonomuraea sp. NPDC050783]|uniref:DoxX family membrane protein n=1 Tax=Nonomuraea sp. NPDC050783 TaxID=3154634 RepID=UPI003464FC4A
MKRVVFDVAALIARVVTGVIFLAHGLQKWQGGLGATTGMFREMGIPMPGLAAGFATVVETVGGIFLILGLLVRPVGLLLLLNMLGAIAFFHWNKGVMVGNGGWELAAALGALSLLFLALGGGRIGLDGLFGAIFRRRGERRAADELARRHAGSVDDRIETPPTGTSRDTAYDTAYDDTTHGTAHGTAYDTPGTGAGIAGTSAGAGMGSRGRHAGGPLTPAEPQEPAEPPEIPRQPAAPAPGTPASGTPASGTPASGTPASGTRAPGTRTPGAGTPGPGTSGAGGLSDEDRRDIDALVADDQPEHRRPPNR